jgi:glycosyltransferase involved in cell wall biosynthesis
MPGTPVAAIFGVRPGIGGLGVQVANALRALAAGTAVVHAIGPAPRDEIVSELGPRVIWHVPSEPLPHVIGGRWRAGAEQLAQDAAIGRFAAATVSTLRPALCYTFTQVALETLEWARTQQVATVLENPNGHISNFRQVYVDEARRWCHGLFPGHPTRHMVERVEREYLLADRIRVSSEWSKRSMVDLGVPGSRITVLQQIVDTNRFRPATRLPPEGPLRVSFVGTLDLRKGFVYLLEAMRTLGNRAALEIVGATGDWCSRHVYENAAQGLSVRCAPGDPLPVLQRSEVFVLPTLEDGSPFAAAEAMACGVPVVTTRDNGSAEWIREGQTGWIVPARDAAALAAALQAAIARRPRLADMGAAARADTVVRTDRRTLEDVFAWAMSGRAVAC